MNVFARIRDATAWVAGRSRFVRIVDDRVDAFARSLPVDRLLKPELDAAAHHLGHGLDTLAFMLVLDAVNFGSGYFPHLRKRAGMSGYFTVATALTERFRSDGPFTAAELEQIDAAACATLFGQTLDDASIAELMGLFAQAWNGLGRLVTREHRGSFAALVQSAGGSAARLVETLASMPFYRDVETYDGRDVPFLKRAQITVADLALAGAGTDWGRFTDLAELTMFADNLVPHVLRVEGVLAYDPDLIARIEREDLLVLGSPEEIEIRACAVTVVERIVAVLRLAGHPVTAQQVDYLLWHRGQEKQFKAIPRHRCRCTYY